MPLGNLTVSRQRFGRDRPDFAMNRYFDNSGKTKHASMRQEQHRNTHSKKGIRRYLLTYKRRLAVYF